MNRIKKILSVILTIVITITAVSVLYSDNAVQAASYKYRNYGNFGSYPSFSNIDEVVSYMHSNIISRTPTTFYYEGNLGGMTTRDFISSVYNRAVSHNGISDQGDYLRYNRISYSYSYACIPRALANGGSAYYFDFTYNPRTTAAQEAELKSAINNIILSLNLYGKNDYQKVEAIYGWITENVSYDYSSYENSDPASLCYTAYAACVNKYSVCEGIALLFYRMCLEVGVDCRVVASDNHAWNIVKVGDSYYNADPTWDLGSSRRNYYYFLQPSSVSFTSQHPLIDPLYNEYRIADSECTGMPENTSSNNNNNNNNSNNNNSNNNNNNNNNNSAETVFSNDVTGFVQRMYAIVLDRPFDSSGVSYWTSMLYSGEKDGATVARGFFDSPEFISRNVNNYTYVYILYRAFFNRDPDTAGFNNWMNALSNGSSRISVRESFINSAEWANTCLGFGIRSGSSARPTIRVSPNSQTIAFVERMYTVALGRTAETAGLNYWADALANREDSGSSVAFFFFMSDEFRGQQNSDEVFVTRLYGTFFDRQPDSEGFSYWLRRLQNGDSRETILNEFVYSNEFNNICNSYGINRT